MLDTEYKRSIGILNKLVGLDSIADVKKNIYSYDGISGATRTADGQLSAVENALERSRKFKADNKEQDIEYFEFYKRPDPLAASDKLDLSKVVLTVKKKNMAEVKVGFEDFEKYGITTEPANGSILPEAGKRVVVHFKNDDNLIDIFSEVQQKKSVVKRYPTKIEVKYKDETVENIELTKDEFRYTLKSGKAVSSMTLYSEAQKLAEGSYHADTAEWEFDLKNVEVGAGYTSWAFDTYKVKVDAGWDTSEVADFELDTKLVNLNYTVGDKFNIDGLIVSYTTKNGSKKRYKDWKEAANAEFTSSIENGHVFDASEVGKKDVTISKRVGNQTLSKTFEINVVDTSSKVPAKVEIYSGEDKILSFDVNKAEFEAANRNLKKLNQEVDKKYEANATKFTAKVYNESGQALDITTTAKKAFFRISIATREGEDPSIIMLTFKFVEGKSADSGSTPQPPQPQQPPKTEEPKTKTVEDEEEVVEVEDGETTDFEYKAKVRVTFDEKTKKIIKVEDNGTNPEASSNSNTNKQNKKAWKKITNDFWSKFVGKGESDIDGIDAVAGATRSTDAIKKAVKRALSK